MIRMAVVAAGELHDEVATGRRARDADRAHHRLGAGRHEAHLLETRIGAGDALRQLDFALAGRAVSGAGAARLADRGDDGRMGVTQDQRTPGADEVEEAPAVGVEEMRALRRAR